MNHFRMKTCGHKEKVMWSAILIFIGVISFCGLAVANEQGEKRSATISIEDFVKSPVAEFFQAGDYEHALKALEPLIQQYPKDPLLIRYRAMALDRLGRSKEAISIFQELLKQDPKHVPTRYFLGEAYERSGDRESAIREWRGVAERAEGTPYYEWSQESLGRVGVSVVPQKPKVMRWNVAGRYGYEYDTNVILKPENKSLASSRDPSAGRHILELMLRYRMFSRRDLAVDLNYAARQSLHDDSLNEFNFTSQEWGLNTRKRLTIFGRDVIFGGQYDLLAGFLNGRTFSLKNRGTVSADTRLTAQTRSVLSYRFTVANFGPDGSNPPQTSRDGIYQDVGLTQYWYTKDFRRHLFVREEFNRADTRGGNFELRGNTTRVGIHTPVMRKTELDVSGGLQFATYPRFTSLSTLDTNRRRDLEWDLYSGLTYYLTPRLGLRVFYRYINSDNRNGFFEYDRHIGGAQLIFAQSF